MMFAAHHSAQPGLEKLEGEQVVIRLLLAEGHYQVQLIVPEHRQQVHSAAAVDLDGHVRVHGQELLHH